MNDKEIKQAIKDNKLLGSICPKCGGIAYDEEITSSNSGAMFYCLEDNCDYRCNQFLTYEDFCELEI